LASAVPIDVVAGLLRDPRGRVLLAARPPGSHLAGLWEFPGGKVEPGESHAEALQRELHEELGIQIGPSEALMEVLCPGADTAIRLSLRTVPTWQGAPRGLDGQTLRWQHPEQIDRQTLTPADRYLLPAARLPAVYLITGASDTGPEFLQRAGDHLQQGVRLLQLRLPKALALHRQEIALRCSILARKYGAEVLLNGSLKAAAEAGIGCHLPAREMMQLDEKAVGRWRADRVVPCLLAASCHNADELQQAEAIGCDFAVLSPLKATSSHPRATLLGMDTFARLLRAARIPVYALGGLRRDDLTMVRAAGGQGVAGISAFW